MKWFDKKKFTLELLKLSDMYQVKLLREQILAHLIHGITDENATEAWVMAEKFGNDQLKTKALKHIIKKKGKLPGMDEAVKSPELMQSLIDYVGSANEGKARLFRLEENENTEAFKMGWHLSPILKPLLVTLTLLMRSSNWNCRICQRFKYTINFSNSKVGKI